MPRWLWAVLLVLLAAPAHADGDGSRTPRLHRVGRYLVDQYGRVEVSYTDDCFGECASGQKQTPENTSIGNVSVAYQTGGKPLFAKYDHLFAKR